MKTLQKTIRDSIVSFPWHNFGLDEVGDADPEYADALAERIRRNITDWSGTLQTTIESGTDG